MKAQPPDFVPIGALGVDYNAGTRAEQNENAEKLITGAGSSLALYNKIQSTESNNHPKQTRGIPISTLIMQ